MSEGVATSDFFPTASLSILPLVQHNKFIHPDLAHYQSLIYYFFPVCSYLLKYWDFYCGHLVSSM